MINIAEKVKDLVLPDPDINLILSKALSLIAEKLDAIEDFFNQPTPEL